mmetsp:Transcript_42599/g.85286  ORF Transcript_42599/g.85286 Transcript_42599/m.85286 type:complete len:340 (-) Transcript_42599:1864-2883(-)
MNTSDRFFHTTQHFGQCAECAGEDLVEDRKQGDVVCRNCGLVVMGHIIDFTSEWRSFAEDQRTNDPNRVGGPLHPLLESTIGTLISKGLKGSNSFNEKLIKVQNQNRIQKTDRFLIQTFNKILIFLEKGFLSQGLKEKVEELFKLYFNHLTLRSDGSRTKSALRNDETMAIIAATIFIVCRNEGVPRTFKEISEITKVPKKEIGARVRAIEKSLWGVRISKGRNTEDFVSRFCSQLGLPKEIGKIAENIANVVREKDGLYGRTYVSVAAAAIYIVSQIPNYKINCSLKEISKITGVSEITIRAAQKAMYPYRNEILQYITQKDPKLKDYISSPLFLTAI